MHSYHEWLPALGMAVIGTIPVTIALAVVFTCLSAMYPCNPAKTLWRRQELIADLCWWFIYPLLARYMNLVLMLFGAGVLILILKVPEENVDFRFAPFAGLPFWAHVVLYFALSDLMMYWTHRAFHGKQLWHYHAVHHSSEELDWISARRFHPVDQFLHVGVPYAILVFLGISPEVIAIVAPFETWHSALVHANVRWDFGPLKYVIASPIYHRWHHTDVAHGGMKNFAATFPIFDIAFGTFYMPPKVLPERYGIDDPSFPPSFKAQLLYPFRKSGPQTVAPATATGSRPRPSGAPQVDTPLP